MGVFRKQLTLRTMATPQAVIDALTREVRPGQVLEFDLPGRDGDVREFRGEVKGHQFRFVRRVQYRNSFAPLIEGRVTEAPGGAELTAELSVPTTLLLFVVAWTVIAAASGMIAVQQAMLLPDAPLAPLVMAIPFVGVGLAWVGFTVEAANSAKVLRGLVPPALTSAPAAESVTGNG